MVPWLLAVLLIPTLATASTYIVFRYDDFAADQEGVRQRNELRRRIWRAEQDIDALFEKYGMAYVIAVIPEAGPPYGGTVAANDTVSFAEDSEKIEFIKRGIQAERMEVAQHGLAHNNVVGSNHRPGEFRERDYESQLRDIARGREILLNSCNLADINTFVPPWNAWTDDTAKILGKTGFEILSADRYYYYDSVGGLTVIPFTAVLQELELMLEHGGLPEQGIVVVVYHPFEIVQFPDDLGSCYFGVERFEKLLQKLSTVADIRVVMLQQLANEVGALTTERYQLASSLWRQRCFWAKLLPEHLLPAAGSAQLYLTCDEYSEKLWGWRAASAGLMAGLIMIGLLVRYLLGLVFADKWSFTIDVLVALLFCLAIAAELRLMQRGYHASGIRALPLFFSVSFVIALILRIFRKAKSRCQRLLHLNVDSGV